MKEPFSLLAIGEVMAEIRRGTDGAFKVGFAGDTYNTAVYCARALKRDGAVGYVTRIGHDPLSSGLMEMAREEGLDVGGFGLDDERSIGVYAVATDENGERSFSYWRENSAARNLFSNEADLQQLQSANITYLSGISLAVLRPDARRRLMDRLAELSSTKQTLVAFDSNYRPQLWENKQVAQQTIREMWEIADVALPSIDDEQALFDDATESGVVERFAERQWHACAIKRGERGPLSLTLSNEKSPEFPSARSVVDTTAAGDSFNGGYLAALLRGENEAGCLVAGHLMASNVVGVSGAIIPGD